MEKRKRTKEAEESMTGKMLKYEGVRPKPNNRKSNLFLWRERRPSPPAFIFQWLDSYKQQVQFWGAALPLGLSQSFHELVTPDDLRRGPESRPV